MLWSLHISDAFSFPLSNDILIAVTLGKNTDRRERYERSASSDFLHFLSAAFNFLQLLRSMSDSQGAGKDDFLGLED